MINKDNFTNLITKDYETDEEIVCATKVAAELKSSGVKLTERMALILTLLQITQTNICLNTKVTELCIEFQDTIFYFLDQKNQEG